MTLEPLPVDPQIRQRLVVRPIALLALRTQHPHQTLGDDRDHRRGHKERLDPHVDQPSHRARRVIRVQRRKNQMSRQRRLDRDLRRLPVPDLTHQNHIRVLPDDRPQPLGEGQVDLRVHLDLTDPLDLVLDRVLDRDDVHLRRN